MNISPRAWWKDRAPLLLSAVGASIAITLFSIGGTRRESTVILSVIAFVSLIADNRRRVRSIPL